MREGWESEASNWANFARTPGYDNSHETVNKPALLDLLPAPGHLTLDLACGEGRISRLLRSLGHRVVGIDASPAMVRFAATHEDRGPVVLGDGALLPFGDGVFDVVVAYMCLHDFDQLGPAVAEIGRVLCQSGRLCLAIPHPINSAGAFAGREPDAPFVIAGSYLDPMATGAFLERGEVRLTFHSEHRPLQAYADALEAAGLLIKRIREIAVPGQAVASSAAAARWRRIPLFLHVRAVKG
jgi:SAM-dependent methyltransferase